MTRQFTDAQGRICTMSDAEVQQQAEALVPAYERLKAEYPDWPANMLTNHMRENFFRPQVATIWKGDIARIEAALLQIVSPSDQTAYL